MSTDTEHLKPTLPESTKTATLTWEDGKKVECPILEPTLGAPMIDIRNFARDAGHYVYDPGFTCTGSCASKITFLNGGKGELYYRGYPIQDLAEKCSFVENIYLLLHGELPSKPELEKFELYLVNQMMIHSKMIELYGSFKSGAHPMAIMVGVVGAFSAFSPETNSYNLTAEQREEKCIKMIAKMPMIAALSYRAHMGLPVVYPNAKLGYVENFLMMMFKHPSKEWELDAEIISAIDKIMTLHADHEQNASTSTVRIAASSNANPYACIAAGISSLWGPAHGGANEACIKMLEEIGTIENIPLYVAKAKDRDDPFRIMGFGHRVYKNYDPRATIMRGIVYKVMETVGKSDPLMDVAIELERIALSDEYFIKRKLYPNVDFYTGIAYRLIGIPMDMYTVMFAMARTVGWMTQWKEFMIDDYKKVTRPRQLYVGEVERPFLKKEDRDEVSRLPKINKIAGLMNLPIL